MSTEEEAELRRQHSGFQPHRPPNMPPRVPVDGAQADGVKPRWARRDWARRLLTAALLCFTAGSVSADCTSPDARENMVLTGEDLLKNDFPEGSTATFQCHVGYIRERGSGTTSCIGGKWTAVTLKCKKKSCGSPGEVLNGRFDFTEGIEFGAIVKAICNEGYEIVGQDYRQCLDQGWTGRIPTCEVVQCNEPPEIPNGKIVSRPSSEFPQYRDTIEYECNAGYTLVGDMNIMCNANGKYEPQAPECRDIICEAPKVPNSHRVAGALPPYKLNNFVTFACNNGYEMDGRPQMTCTVNGWSHWPTCKPVKCDEPPEIPNGRIIRGSSGEFPQYRDTIEYECNAGYMLFGKSTITCNANGKYEPQAPECRDIICETPQVPNSHRVGGALPPYKLDSFVTFVCDNGYEMDGRAEMTCTVNGWSHWPTCKPVKCDEPPEIPNGRIIRGSSSEFPQYRDTIEYKCNAGYMLVGDMHIMCNANGKYEPQAPECRDIICETPQVPNAHRVGGALPPYKLDSFVTFVCDNGYEMDGRAEMTCTVNGWSHWPTCKPSHNNLVVIGVIIGLAALITGTIVGYLYVKHKKKTGTRDYQPAAAH